MVDCRKIFATHTKIFHLSSSQLKCIPAPLQPSHTRMVRTSPAGPGATPPAAGVRVISCHAPRSLSRRTLEQFSQSETRLVVT